MVGGILTPNDADALNCGVCEYAMDYVMTMQVATVKDVNMVSLSGVISAPKAVDITRILKQKAFPPLATEGPKERNMKICPLLLALTMGKESYEPHKTLESCKGVELGSFSESPGRRCPRSC